MGKRSEGQPDRRHQNPGRPPGKSHPNLKMVRLTDEEVVELADLAERLALPEAAVFRLGLKELAAREKRKAKP